MKDHAQAKIRLIDAAINVAKTVAIQDELTLDQLELVCLRQLKRAVDEYAKTKQAKRVDENGNEWDTFGNG